MLNHLRQNPAVGGLVRAVMGSGKSAAIAGICRSIRLSRGEHVVITTPSRMLVNQLYRQIFSWLPRQVGRFFSSEKAWNLPVVICCAPSARKLGNIFRQHRRRVCCWIADEAHGTECDQLREAYEAFLPDSVLGFTATAYRANEQERLSIYRTLLYNYRPVDAIRDKIVVPWRVIGYRSAGPKLRDDACIEMIRDAVGPGIINADSIPDAQAYAERLTKEGIAAEPFYSRMKRNELELALSRLKSGKLRTLVHVSMLAQGVDLPWLKWMCLRRPVTSRVRFAQEVGRSLRASPGKTEAVIYDPHDLFGTFHLEYEAVLGGEVEEPEKTAAKKIEFNQIVFTKNIPAVARTSLEIWLRQLSLAFDVSGIAERWVGDSWRHKDASLPQLAAVRNRKWVVERPVVPDDQRAGLKVAVEHASELTRGACSDLIGVLEGIIATSQWPRVMVPPPLDLAAFAEDRAVKAMSILSDVSEA